MMPIMMERYPWGKEQGKDPSGKKAAKVDRGLLATLGDEPREKGRSEIYIVEDLKKQSRKLARLFAKELGLSREEYFESLPIFEPQPEAFQGKFDIPVIVETRVPLGRMLEIVKINAFFNIGEIEDWKDGGSKIAKCPYIAWLKDGGGNLDVSVRNVRKNLASDERGGTIHDGLALYLRNPIILEHHFLDFPGSQVGSGSAPNLHLLYGGPGLDHRSVDHANPRFGPVVAGKL